MKSIIRQGTYFTVISGIGWCIDFGVFSLLGIYVGIPVAYANMLSSLPAITFVFSDGYAIYLCAAWWRNEDLAKISGICHLSGGFGDSSFVFDTVCIWRTEFNPDRYFI